MLSAILNNCFLDRFMPIASVVLPVIAGVNAESDVSILPLAAKVSHAMHDQIAIAKVALRAKDLFLICIFAISCRSTVFGILKPSGDIIAYEVERGKGRW